MQPPQNPYNQPPLSNPQGGPVYGMPNVMGQNDSGTGATAVLPPELRGVNVGAFFLNWIWAIAHSTWLGLLCLVPCVGTVMAFVLLFKGNEYAWQNRRWESVQQFQEVQKKWMMWGIIIFALGLILNVFSFIGGMRNASTYSSGGARSSIPATR